MFFMVRFLCFKGYAHFLKSLSLSHYEDIMTILC